MMNKFKKILSFSAIIAFTSFISLQSQELKKVNKFFKTEYYKGDELIPKTDFITYIETNEKATKHWNKSKVFTTLSIVSLASELGFVTWGLSDGKTSNSVASTGVYSSFGAVIIFSILTKLQEDRSISEYNKDVNKTKSISFKPSQKGLGIVMQF